MALYLGSRRLAHPGLGHPPDKAITFFIIAALKPFQRLRRIVGNCPRVLGFNGECMVRAMFSIAFSIVVLPVAAGAGSGMPTVVPGASAVYQPQRWKHVSGREKDAQIPLIHPSPSAVQANPSDISRSLIPVVSTGSTFFARWASVSTATGYRLDVSQQESFNSYVDGYRDLDVGNMTGRVVTGLSPATKYYYRVRAYNAAGSSADSQVMVGTTASKAGLIINATFDSSITNNPNALAIQSMITLAVSIFENLFSDPVTVPILFRYSASDADGSSLGSALSDSISAIYPIPWNTYITALRAHATSNNDTMANASLPATALSTNVDPSGANGRAIGLNTPPGVSANGKVGSGPGFIYDGVITLNSSDPFQFTRPVNSGNYDAQRSTEHEIDEVLGLGSHVNGGGRNLEPQDLFSWSSSGTRNITSSGTRFFSIDSGTTDIVDFNQDPSGDFGDWLSTPCPQPEPNVQNAFACTGQSSDVSASSPEGISLDVIGYTLGTPPLVNISTRGLVQTGGNVMIGGFIVTGTASKTVVLRALGPTLGQPPFNIAGVLADPTLQLFDSGGHPFWFNDNWKDTQQAQIQATGLAPPNDLESAILQILQPGKYTAILSGKNNTTGIGLVEVYDISTGVSAEITNVSTRGFVGTNQEVMIAGVITSGGNGSTEIVARGLGPTLTQLGVANALADPVVTLVNNMGTVVATNDNWKNTQQAAIQATGLAPPNDLESAILTTLAAGNYTAILSGMGGGTGTGLVEVYKLR